MRVKELKKMNKFQKSVFILSIVFFFISLTQMSFCANGRCQNDGLTNLLMGWFAIFMLYPIGMVWLANPILFFSWIKFKKKPKISLVSSVISLLLMLSFLLFDEVVNNEAGVPEKITDIKLGYWLWVLSAFIMVIGNAFLFYNKNKEETKQFI